MFSTQLVAAARRDQGRVTDRVDIRGRKKGFKRDRRIKRETGIARIQASRERERECERE